MPSRPQPTPPRCTSPAKNATIRHLKGLMKDLRGILIWQLLTAIALGQSPATSGTVGLPDQPEALVQSLYNQVVALHPLGNSLGGHMRVFAPYLSKALQHNIEMANACSDDWYRQNPDPDLKAPGLEGGVFSGDDDRSEPQSFSIERAQAQKGTFLVYVRLKWEEPSDLRPMRTEPLARDTWRVAAVVVRENGRLVVDDVIWLKDKWWNADLRMSDYIAQGCDGPHWIGHGNKQTEPRR